MCFLLSHPFWDWASPVPRAVACTARPAKSVLILWECKSLELFFILALCLSFPLLVGETSVSSVSRLERAEDIQEV